jgi:hypothetical protein
MKTLTVNVGELAAALDDHNRELTTYYFDSKTGEIVYLSEEMRGDDKRWNVISNSVGRFFLIEPMDSRKGYEIMEQFVETLPPTSLREKLEWSLEGPKAKKLCGFQTKRETVNRALQWRLRRAPT